MDIKMYIETYFYNFLKDTAFLNLISRHFYLLSLRVTMKTSCVGVFGSIYYYISQVSTYYFGVLISSSCLIGFRILVCIYYFAKKDYSFILTSY